MPLTDVQIHDGVFGVAVPAGVGFFGALLGLWFGKRDADRSKSSVWSERVSVLGPVLGFGAGYVLTIALIQGLPPNGLLTRSASHLQSLVVVLAVLLAGVDAFLRQGTRRTTFRWIGRAAIVAVVLAFQLRSAREYQWSAGLEEMAWTAGIGLWMLLTFVALDTTFTRSTTTASMVPLAIFAVFSIPAIFDAGATAQWQISLGMAAAMFGVAAAGLIVHDQRLGHPPATLLAVWFSGIVVLVYWYSEMPLWHAVIVALAPLAVPMPDVLWPKMCRHRRLALRSGIAAALGLSMSYGALPGFVHMAFGV